MPETPPDASRTSAGDLALVNKHSHAIRWMHWINFPLLTIMIWSGLLIYWGDSIPPYVHAHQVYRVGIGSWTLFRFFPDWFWKLLNAPYRLTDGLGWHFLTMWFFGINGILYALYLAISGEWRVLWPKARSFSDAIQVTLYDLHLPSARRRGLPAQGKYNGAQRIAYTAVVLMGAGSLMTGLAIYKPAQTQLDHHTARRLRDGAVGTFLAQPSASAASSWSTCCKSSSPGGTTSAPWSAGMKSRNAQGILLTPKAASPPAASTKTCPLLPSLKEAKHERTRRVPRQFK